MSWMDKIIGESLVGLMQCIS